jgi:hypothetical protein
MKWPFIEPYDIIVGNSALPVKQRVVLRKVLKKMGRSGIKKAPFRTVDGVGCF